MTNRVEELLSIITQDDLVKLLSDRDWALQPKAAAAYLRVSVRGLEEWRRRGLGPRWRKVGRRVIYRFRDLEAFLEQRSRGSSDHDTQSPVRHQRLESDDCTVADDFTRTTFHHNRRDETP